MKNKKSEFWLNISVVASVTLMITLAFQNCSPMHYALTASSSFENPILDPNDENFDPSIFETAAKGVLSQRCYICHDAAASQGGFGSIENTGTMIQQGLIVPGQANASLLYQVMNNGTMPLTGRLPETELEAIRLWINIGLAPKDSGKDDDSSDQEEEVPPIVYYTELRQQVFQMECLSCHNSTADGGIRLDRYNDALTTIIPGNPEASLLYDSVAQERMPKNRSPLSTEQRQMIYNWIRYGAQQRPPEN